jgi:DNA-directed RNA polymerase subunit L
MNLKLIPMNEETLQVQIENGDYSVSDIIHKELLEVKHVKFAGVAPPHPLIKRLLIQIQTDGELSPDKALEKALQGAQKTVTELLEMARKTFPDVPQLLLKETLGNVPAASESSVRAPTVSDPPQTTENQVA